VHRPLKAHSGLQKGWLERMQAITRTDPAFEEEQDVLAVPHGL
jgi:hypothetical protein